MERSAPTPVRPMLPVPGRMDARSGLSGTVGAGTPAAATSQLLAPTSSSHSIRAILAWSASRPLRMARMLFWMPFSPLHLFTTSGYLSATEYSLRHSLHLRSAGQPSYQPPAKTAGGPSACDLTLAICCPPYGASTALTASQALSHP